MSTEESDGFRHDWERLMEVDAEGFRAAPDRSR
jgi:hypothetical protein